jgi:hypothetical protein
MTSRMSNRRFLMPALALAGLLLCMSLSVNAASPALEAPAEISGLRQVHDVKQFEVGVPVGWSRYSSAFGLSPEEKGVFDLVVLGPPSVEGIRSEIRVAYYAPGNMICKTVEKYLRLHTQPVFGSPSPGETYGTVREERIRGRTAWVFERGKFEFLPPESVEPQKIPVHERYVVISAREGFFVLHCYAGLDRKAIVLALFEAVLASFKPLVD